MPLHETPSGKCFQRHDLLNFINVLYDGDLHAKRVLSLANATLGVLTSASLAIHAVGRGLAQAMGTLTKHGVKQVDRLLSNRGVHVWTFFAYWTPYIVGARSEVVVALDWTSFAPDAQDTIVLSMVTGHGRATPLLWKTVASSTLKGNQRRYEYEVLCRLREVLPAGVKVTVVADRGFADCKLFYALATELGFERDSVARRRLCDECARRTASGRRVGRGRRARTAAGGCSGDRRARMACGRGRVRTRPEDGRTVVFGGQRSDGSDAGSDSLLRQALGDRGAPVDRYYLQQFVRSIRPIVRGRCLEIGGSLKNNWFYRFDVDEFRTLELKQSKVADDLVGDAADPGVFDPASWDSILAFHVLEHCPNPFAVVSNMCAWLKPDGHACIVVPCAQRVHNYPGDYWRFMPDGLRVLFRDFSEVNVSTYGNPLTVVSSYLGLSHTELVAEDRDAVHPDYPVLACVVARK